MSFEPKPKVVKKPLTPVEILKTPPTRWETIRGGFECLPDVAQAFVCVSLFIIYLFSVYGICKYFGIKQFTLEIVLTPLVVLLVYLFFTQDNRGKPPGSTLTGSGYFK